MTKRPNIILILNDDMGYSDLSCYGGEVDTPNLDSLAAGGLRYKQFYNTARCCPSRASLLTGLYPHQANVGHMTNNHGIDGYEGTLSQNAVTIAEVLHDAGYATRMSGKWHVSEEHENYNWPCQRGFDEFYGTVCGAGNFFAPKSLTHNNEPIEPPRDTGYYYTDAISEHAAACIKDHADAGNDEPFFHYVAYTAPHWPLHAPEETIEKYKGRFDKGWDILRQERLERMREMGILDPSWELSPRDEGVPAWEDAENKEWQLRRMEVYAAQIDRMDQGIGQIIETLKETGQYENTLIMFMADNGGCAEELAEDWKFFPGNLIRLDTCDGLKKIQWGNKPELMPGGEETYQSYGQSWANLSNTPFRYYKHWVHEGGIATPFIVHWPRQIKDAGAFRNSPAQLPDIMATCCEVAQAEYPAQFDEYKIQPLEGFSLADNFQKDEPARETLYWEHEGNKAVREGDWKLVCRYPGDWELYNMSVARTETKDLKKQRPDIAQTLEKKYDAWAQRCGVLPWDELLERSVAIPKK